MHIWSRFDGGKQINRIQSGSLQGRCAGAGLRCNMDRDQKHGEKLWEFHWVFQTAALKAEKRVDQD